MDKSSHLVGDYAVDMYRSNGRVYYTITRKGSAELLSVGDQLTEEQALKQAEWTINEFGTGERSA